MRIVPLLCLAALLPATAGAATPPPQAGVSAACLAAAHANDSLSSYRAIMVSNFGRQQTSTVDLVKPDRFHVTQPVLEMIAVGNRAWRRVGKGPWQPIVGMTGSQLFSTSRINFNRASTCVDGGMGVWHGQPAHLFDSTSTAGGTLSHATIYLMRDGFVHHMSVTSPNGTATMDFVNFNRTTVKPPV